MPRIKWTKEKILKQIRDRYKKKQKLNSSYAQRRLRKLQQASLKRFGSWRKAIKAAGIKYDDVRILKPKPRVWTKEKIIKIIQRRHRLKQPLNSGYMTVKMAPLHVAGQRFFGSWRNAIRSAGLDYSKIKKMRWGWWTKPRILMSIKSLEKRGIQLSITSTRKSHKSLVEAAVRYFGSWSKAVDAAGIPYRAHLRRWSTKYWLDKMDSAQYEVVLEKAQTYAKKAKKV